MIPQLFFSVMRSARAHGAALIAVLCAILFVTGPARAQDPASAPQQQQQSAQPPISRPDQPAVGPRQRMEQQPDPREQNSLQDAPQGQVAIPLDQEPADPAADPPGRIQYHFERPNPVDRFDARQLALIEKLNRVDRRSLGNLREIVVPDQWDLPTLAYSPLPEFVPGLAGDSKAIVVYQPGQVFGAYEDGRLVRWGPVNTGKASTPTPPGFHRLNWKSVLRTSSVNPTWKMPYYSNFDDKRGLGFHEYHLAGQPSSHGCIRMLAADAQWLFSWGDLGERGTPVAIIGQYRFGAPKPWMQPEWLAHRVRLPADLMNAGAA